MSMFRKILSLLLFAGIAVFCVGCNYPAAELGDTPPVDGTDTLVGSWSVGGIYIDEKLIDVNDNKTIAEMYTDFLSFYEDGLFHYSALVERQGLYARIPDSENSFLLTVEKVYSLSESERLQRMAENENSSHLLYLVTVLDENTLQFDTYDPIFGEAKTDSIPLLFVRTSQESTYIANNKTVLKK